MIIYLHEYNVTADINKKEELIVKVADDTIIYNNIKMVNEKIVDEIKEIIISYRDHLLEAKNIKSSNYKGGKQKQLSIYCKEICSEKIILVGNTENEKIVQLYDELKNKLISLLEIN